MITLSALTNARNLYPALLGYLLGQLIAGVGVAEDAHTGVGGEHAAQALECRGLATLQRWSLRNILPQEVEQINSHGLNPQIPAAIRLKQTASLPPVYIV